MKLASLKIRGTGSKLMILNLTMILPTVVFNGAYWGQCDAIYCSLCLMALYMGLKKRGAACMMFFGAALSFKLQTVFFLPALLPLWLRKDIKLRHVLLIPVAYLGMMVPAFWGGKSLHHALTVYMTQAGTYNFITVNGFPAGGHGQGDALHDVQRHGACAGHGDAGCRLLAALPAP